MIPASVLRGLAAALALWSAASASPARADTRVVATTPDLKSIAEAVSGGTVKVESLVPAGADAEEFDPRPSHLAAIRGAALVLRVGLGYDEWLDRLLARSGEPALGRSGERHLDLSTEIALLEVQGRSVETRSGHAHGSANPHYWLDPSNLRILSAQVAEALTRAVPHERERIEAAHVRFNADLDERMQRWTKAFEPHRGAAIIVYHNSWPYFARHFRLDIVDVIESKEGVAPNAPRLAALAKRMRDRNVRVILHEPFEPLSASDFLAKRTGAEIVQLAPSVGSKPEATDILSLFDHNVDLLAKALAKAR